MRSEPDEQPLSLQDELQMSEINSDDVINETKPAETSNFRTIFAKLFTLIRTTTDASEQVTWLTTHQKSVDFYAKNENNVDFYANLGPLPSSATIDWFNFS